MDSDSESFAESAITLIWHDNDKVSPSISHMLSLDSDSLVNVKLLRRQHHSPHELRICTLWNWHFVHSFGT